MSAFPMTGRLLAKLPRPRLIPAVVAVTTLAAGLKVGEVGSDLAIAFGFQTAGAQQAQTATPAQRKDGPVPLTPQAKDKAAAPAETAKPTAPSQPQSQAQAQAQSQPQAKAAQPAPKSPAAPEPTAPSAAAKPAAESNATQLAARDPASFSKSELELLQELSQRREALDQRARELELREATLGATARQLDEKVGELKAIENRIKGLLKQRDEQEEQSLRSLVKVYENMKPADAGRIFEQLDMPILLDVVERMKEVKVAPVLAVMNPQKAKAITQELAARRQIPARMPAAESGKPSGKAG